MESMADRLSCLISGPADCEHNRRLRNALDCGCRHHLLRGRIGRQRWKSFHFLVYAAAACILAHGILAHPKPSSDSIDPLDTEKLLIGLCLLIITVSSQGAIARRAHLASPAAETVAGRSAPINNHSS